MDTLYTTAFIERSYILPHFKYSAIQANSCLSLVCWLIWNINSTYGLELLLACLTLTPNDPSPLANPANHWGLYIKIFSFTGLKTHVISGKASFNDSDKPLFIDAL